MRRSARVERGVGCARRVQPSPYRSLERPVTARRRVVEQGEQRLLKAAGSVKHLLVEVSGPSAPWSGGAPVDLYLVRWSLRSTHHADLLEVSNQISAAG